MPGGPERWRRARGSEMRKVAWVRSKSVTLGVLFGGVCVCVVVGGDPECVLDSYPSQFSEQ